MIVLERDGTELEIGLACLFEERESKDLPFDILAAEVLRRIKRYSTKICGMGRIERNGRNERGRLSLNGLIPQASIIYLGSKGPESSEAYLHLSHA